MSEWKSDVIFAFQSHFSPRPCSPEVNDIISILLGLAWPLFPSRACALLRGWLSRGLNTGQVCERRLCVHMCMCEGENGWRRRRVVVAVLMVGGGEVAVWSFWKCHRILALWVRGWGWRGGGWEKGMEGWVGGGWGLDTGGGGWGGGGGKWVNLWVRGSVHLPRTHTPTHTHKHTHTEVCNHSCECLHEPIN